MSFDIEKLRDNELFAGIWIRPVAPEPEDVVEEIVTGSARSDRGAYPHRGPASNETRDLVVKLRKQGVETAQIAERVGLNQNTICGILSRAKRIENGNA